MTDDNRNSSSSMEGIRSTGSSIWNFDKCRTYSDLAIIKIVNNPFAMEGPISYGLICITEDTGTCLMIRRKHSIGLLSILKGFYKREDIPEYIRSMNTSERKTILRCLISLKEFSSVVRETNGYNFKHYERDSYEYLISCQDLIYKCLDLYGETDSELEYGWPKGLKGLTEEGIQEEGLNAAIRELLEESGVSDLNVEYQMSRENISCCTTSSMGYTYCSKFWICVLKSEFKIPLVHSQELEVSERSWIPISDVENCIPARLHSTWRQALDIYHQMVPVA